MFKLFTEGLCLQIELCFWIWMWCFLQDLLGRRPLGQDREFRPERETASDPRQPGVPPVRPHAGTPHPPPPLLTLSFQSLGWTFLLAASSTHLLSFTRLFTVWLPPVVSSSFNPYWTHSAQPFLLLPFHSDPHFSSSSLPSLSSSHTPAPCLCFSSPLFFSLVSPVEAGVLPSNSFLPTLAARPLDLLDRLAD